MTKTIKRPGTSWGGVPPALTYGSTVAANSYHASTIYLPAAFIAGGGKRLGLQFDPYDGVQTHPRRMDNLATEAPRTPMESTMVGARATSLETDFVPGNDAFGEAFFT